jgi:S1-C subfamily serine protease
MVHEKQKETEMKKLITIITMLAVLAMASAGMAATRFSVVTLYSEEGKGTGFFVTRNLIMTNHHVVCEDNPYAKCESEIVIQHSLYGKVAGKVVASDQDLDLALVFMAGNGPKPMEFCSASKIGDEVEVWTREFGRFKTRQGVILQAWIDTYVTSTGLIAGNSGSPLMRGDCVTGVSRSTYTSNNQSIHVNEYQAKKFLDEYLVRAAVK